jgi:hypothetical protein
MCVWSGSLTPAFQTYDIRVAFVPGFDDGTLNFTYGSVKVWVTNPTLTRRVSEPEKKIPHLYEQPQPERAPKLCLYLPSDSNWNPLLPVSEYIIPWISEWLLNYEMWHVTGNWASIEAPHDMPDSDKDASSRTSDEPSQKISTQFLASASNRLKSTSALQSFPYIVQRYCPVTSLTPPPSATPQ